jgi:outer membrane protein assembly factor BamB
MVANSDSAWTSFRRDDGNSGCSPFPIQPKSKEPVGDVRSVALGGLIWGTPVVDRNGDIYVGSTNKRFYCVDGGTWKVKWRYRITNRADSLIDSAAGLNELHGTVIVPGGDGYLHCLDKDTGTIRWKFHASGGASEEMHRSGVVVNSFEGNVKCSKDGARVYAGCDNNWFYCVDAKTGTELWRRETGMMIWTVAALLDTAVLCGSLDGSIYCFDALNGDLLAEYSTGGEIKASIAALSRDRIYVCNSNGCILRLELLNGHGGFREVWRVDMDHEIYGSPAVKDGVVVVVTMGGEMAGLEEGNGRLLWKTDIGGYSTSSPIVTADGVVVLGNSKGRLIAASLTEGEVIGVRVLSERNLNSSPVHLSSGAICIGSYDGALYEIPGWKLLEGDVSLLSTIDADMMGKTHLQDVTIKSGHHIISYCLNAFEKGVLLHNSSIDASKIRAMGLAGYKVIVSPDGRFVNFVPDGFRYLDEVRYQEISGAYFLQTESWLRDRFIWGNSGTFEGSMRLGYRGGEKANMSSSVFDKLAKEQGRIVRWDIANMYCTQPVILDTYIPAALDGQGAIAYACGFNASSGGGGGTFKIIFIPAIPDYEDGFEVLKEPNKVVVMTAEWVENVFHAKADGGGFTFSAMGGTIGFSEFELFGTVDPKTMDILGCQFYAKASCLKVKGNGKSYKFSPEVVNQLCDSKLNINVVGGVDGRYNAAAKNIEQGGGEGKLVVRFDPTTGGMDAHLGAYNGDGGDGCKNALVFVDGVLVGKACMESSSALVFSSDGFFTRGMLGPFIKACCKLGVHPNGLTVSSMVTSAMMIGFHEGWLGPWQLVPICMMYKWFADAVDGPVARTCGRSSALGGALDSMADWMFTVIVIAFGLEMLQRQDKRRQWSRVAVWAVALLAASLPWAALVGMHGWHALWDHGVFKRDEGGWVSAAVWNFTENTFLVIAGVAVAYCLARRK